MVSTLSKSLAVAIYVIVSSTISSNATDRVKRSSVRREEQKEFGRSVYDAVEMERYEHRIDANVYRSEY